MYVQCLSSKNFWSIVIVSIIFRNKYSYSAISIIVDMGAL